MDHNHHSNHGSMDHHPTTVGGHHNHNDMHHSSEEMTDSHHMQPASAMDHMMKMYFHGGYTEVILFDFWRISSIGGLIGSMIGCFLMGVLYEGIKAYREYWMRGAFQEVTYNEVRDDRRKQSDVSEEGGTSSESPPRDIISDQGSLKIIQTKMFSLPHLILTSLHMLQMTLAYFLMLIVMTYNSWLCGAVILGSTLGYFCFGWRKTSIVDVSDHCH